MKYGRELRKYYQEHWEADTAKQIEEVREEMQRLVDEERAKRKAERESYEPTPGSAAHDDRIQPVIIGQNVYVMMPMDLDAGGFRRMLENSPAAREAMESPIEIETEAVEVEK